MIHICICDKQNMTFGCIKMRDERIMRERCKITANNEKRIQSATSGKKNPTLNTNCVDKCCAFASQ